MLLLLSGVDHDWRRLDRWRILCLSWIVCSCISRVFSRAGCRIVACCTTGHRILLSRRHVLSPVLSRWGDEVSLRRSSERQLLLGNHHGWVDMSRCNRASATTCLYPWSTGGHGRSVRIVTRSWLLCRVHLWRCRGGKNERRGLSRAVGSLCQSRRGGRVWDRSGSRYRLWWFVHFTFFYGSALEWRCVASLSGINNQYVVRLELGESASDQSPVNKSSAAVVSLSLTPKEK